jgi:hypothetical protein
MPLVTLLRQDTQIHNSESYDDTIAPSLANFETNPTVLETDLNNIRSQLSNLMDVQAGDWYTDIITPSALETGTQRGVNDINTSLHAVEKKRTLKCVWNLHSISGGASTGVILGVGELPSNTTAAVGAVTTLGTVVAAATVFGTFSATDDVAGSNALFPKNLVQIVETTTRDPILDSGGERIYGLLQTETATDGHTITAVTTTRAQISFVKVNAAGTDLELITAGDMNGKTFDFCGVERVRWEDRTEQDWLGSAEVDQIASGAIVNRQNVYDNQGTTAVDVTTNSTLDLEGAGLTWSIRDDLEAALFTITEGSAGGTSTVALNPAVDTFDVDAVDTDFLNGITVDSGSTGIQLGETAGTIERASDLTVYASGAGELLLHDSNINSEGTWAQAGVKLTETTAEVSAYETEFGGEVSLFNAIVQASQNQAVPTFTRTTQNANAAADANLGGPSTTANNLDVDLPDALTVGTFTSNHALFYNGSLLIPGANAAANEDYYPGSVFTSGNVNIAVEDNTKSGDEYQVWTW